MKAFFIIFHIVILLSLTSCSSSNSHTLKVAATTVPHAEILEHIKPELREKGITLDVVVVEDYNIPNRALNDHEVDANFFQHLPFLEAQRADFGYQLESLAAIHIEPMGLYSLKIQKLADLSPHATIAVPSDPSNQARALLLLEQQGLLSLSRQDIHTSVLDIKDNPQHFKIIEIDSPLLSRTLEDVDLAAITTNFALQAGLSPQKDALALEDAQSLFVNIVVIRTGENSHADLQALKKALTSSNTAQFITDQYQGAIIPILTAKAS